MNTPLMQNKARKQDAEFKRSTSKQVTLGLLTNFSTIAPSMSMGFSAVAIPTLKQSLDANQISWFASIASLATPFGCFFSGPIADRFGRRVAINAINIICFIGWVVIVLAFYVKEYQYVLLLLGRLLTGFSTGLSSSPATIYMAEVSSSNLRSVFTTWGSIFFALGVLVVYMLGFFFKDSWSTIAVITASLPCIGMFLTLYLIPESPTWLVSKHRLEEAKANMYHIFGKTSNRLQVQSEIETLLKTNNSKISTGKKSVRQQFIRKVKYLLEPHCLRPFGLVLIYFFFQQFAGTFVVVFYAIDIVKGAQITMDPYLIIVIIGLVRLVASVIMSYICKRYGRRPLSIFSGSTMAVCMLLLAAFILFDVQEKVSLQYKEYLRFLPLILLLSYFFTSMLGFVPLPFALAAEVFPTKIRGTAAGLLSGLGYLFNFVVVKIYPNMIDSMKSQGVFLFYGFVALVGTIFVFYFLPETKNKSLLEIQEYFGNKENEQEEEVLKV